ncbi:hypothetical protein ZWY2020_019777 [Hordeum vulgare]|nr:hypothetical protein ZWY2020_019777 [Hordeum vulgare]
MAVDELRPGTMTITLIACLCPVGEGKGGSAFSPTHKAAFLNQFQQQQSLLSPRAAATPEPVSPMSSRLLAALAQREKMQQQTLRSMSSRDLGSSALLLVGSPVVGLSWSKWGLLGHPGLGR